MDAISFVLGVKSAQLRSSQLKDLVYRGRRLAKGPADGSQLTQDQEEDENSDEDGEGEGTAKKAWVLAVFQDEKKKEWLFQRTYVIPLPHFRTSSNSNVYYAEYPPPEHPNTVSTTRLSPTLRTTPPSRPTISLSRLRTSSSSKAT